MASSRTIQAPGVELQEFDRSSYKVDTSHRKESLYEKIVQKQAAVW